MPRQLLSAYPPASTRYDEMLDSGHTPRAHRRTMFEQELEVKAIVTPLEAPAPLAQTDAMLAP